MSQSAKSLENKRARRSNFVLRPGLLDAHARNQVGKIPQDSPTDCIKTVIDQVKKGELDLSDVFEGDKRVGFTIYTIENNALGKEFISVASYGESKSDLSRGIVPLLEQMAMTQGCKSIRLHTMREGLCKKLENMGWFVSEIIMRKELIN